MQDALDLAVLIASQTPLVVVETHDEKSVLSLLQRVAREKDIPLFRWSVSDGLEAARFGLQLERDSQFCEPEVLLGHIKSRGQPGIYMLCDFHPWLVDQPKNVRLLKDIALKFERGSMTLVLVSHALQLPPELTRYCVRFPLSLPSGQEIISLIKEEARTWASSNNGKKVRIDNGELLTLLANALQGLSRGEVKRLARTAIYDDGAITESDIPEINRAKFKLMELDGVLTYTYDIENFASLGGMDRLKEWLDLRRQVFIDASEHWADTPKGLMLLGVQGGGKSHAAKAIAGRWGLPILRLDMGALYNKYHGETERNLRESLQLAEQMSPCILWIDEIEKGISGGEGDDGLGQRVLGTLLTWMQERTARVFMVATANDISRLPAELMRKGRFDEIFFIDLPSTDVRKTIFSIHLQKRGLDPKNYPLDELAIASDGFSGAEIEQAIVAALYGASLQKPSLDGEAILNELATTSPLSLVMAEKLHQLRLWATERGIRHA